MEFLESPVQTPLQVVESAEDKCIDKFFQIMLSYKSFYPGYILKVSRLTLS